jgi:hypothetical protein
MGIPSQFLPVEYAFLQPVDTPAAPFPISGEFIALMK